jgi:hypothetical protein
MLESVSAQIDLAFRDRVEHERVVWIGRMAERKRFGGIPCHFEFVTQTVFAFGSYTKHCVTQFAHFGAS